MLSFFFTDKNSYLIRQYTVGLLLAATLLLNISFSTLKYLQATYSLSVSMPERADAFVKAHIPSGSRVISEPSYYYAVVQNGAVFAYMNFQGEPKEREKYHREIFDYEYFILTDHLAWRYREEVNIYLSGAEFDTLARLYEPPSEKYRILSATRLLGIPILSQVFGDGYNAYILKRRK